MFLWVLFLLIAFAALIVAIVALIEANKAKTSTGLQKMSVGNVELVPPNTMDFKQEEMKFIALAGDPQTTIVPVVPSFAQFIGPNTSLEYQTNLFARANNAQFVQVLLECSDLLCIPVPNGFTDPEVLFIFRCSVPMSAFPNYTGSSHHVVAHVGECQNADSGQVGWLAKPVFDANPNDSSLMDVTVQYNFSQPIAQGVLFSCQFWFSLQYQY